MFDAAKFGLVSKTETLGKFKFYLRVFQNAKRRAKFDARCFAFWRFLEFRIFIRAAKAVRAKGRSIGVRRVFWVDFKFARI